MRLCLLLLALLAAAPAAAQPAAFGQYRRAADFPDIATSSQYVTMRDGVRLAVRVDRPARGGQVVEGRFPVIWHHTLSISSTNRDGVGGPASATRSMPDLVRYGYVVVQVARRGNGQSFGVRRGYHDRIEAEDAYEMTEWLARQPFSNGRVGIYGCSNTGDAAMHAMAMLPPALRAVFAGCFSWHKYDAFRRGGIFAQWGTGPVRRVEDDVALPAVDGDSDKALLRQAAQEHLQSTPLFDLWSQMPYRDSFSPLVMSRFWEEGSVAAYRGRLARSQAALYILGGWFDELRDQGIVTHLNMPGSRLVIGPWKHCLNDGFDLQSEMLRFFDFHLKEIDNGLAAMPRVHLAVTDANGAMDWIARNGWEEIPSEATRYYLGDGGRLATRRLRLAPLALPPGPSPACSEAGTGSTIQPCPSHGEGVHFEGAPLARDATVLGYGQVELSVEASADTAIFAYLEDVAPDGTVRAVTEGRLLASLASEQSAPWTLPRGVPWRRAWAADARPVRAGQPVRLRFELMPTGWRFLAGHRIRIRIATSDHRQRGVENFAWPRVTLLGGAQAPVVSLPIRDAVAASLPR
jgi:putative CocE/NonD family hydrolase